MYLDNTAQPVEPVIECVHTNAGNAVMERAPRQTQRPAFFVRSRDLWPKTDVFVARGRAA